VVTKWPTPSAVAFSGETDSMVLVTDRWSPGRRSRAYSCSQLVATTEVNPLESSSPISSSCAEPAPFRGRRPCMVQAWSMVGGAMMPPWLEAAAASGSR
jgi:hypothetical protein